MKWHFRCPKCGDWRNVEWAERGTAVKCHRGLGPYVPPTPTEQPSAYVDEHDAPLEMEDVVRADKGEGCTVPECDEYGDTLDHRVAWENGGRTSVENLFPMCTSHNSSKGTKDYDAWVVEVRLANAIERLKRSQTRR